MEQIHQDIEYERIDPAHIGFTDAQYRSLSILIKDIMSRHPSIPFDRKHNIGHDEYTSRKPDPGALFDWSQSAYRCGNLADDFFNKVPDLSPFKMFVKMEIPITKSFPF